MLDPRVRTQRLREDFAALQRMKCDAFDFDAFMPPAPDRYVLRFKLRSLIKVDGGRPIYSQPGHVHVVHLNLPPEYPDLLSREHVHFAPPSIFHPNVWANGDYCVRGFSLSESLGRFVLRLARTIQFDPAYTGDDSPANHDANSWFRANRRLFPLDRTRLPDLDLPRQFRAGKVFRKGLVQG